jgi:hypothetical protein
MFYFRPFPTTPYRVPGTNNTVSAVDITRRFRIVELIRGLNATYDNYYVKDGERPDIVAYEYYGDVTLDWVILLVNQMHDPYFQWCMSYDQFQEYLKQKYGSVEYALREIHHYEKIIQQETTNYDDEGIIRNIPEKTLTVDYTTYASLIATERKAVTYYEFEEQKNEFNRHILLLDVNMVYVIRETHPYIFEDENI